MKAREERAVEMFATPGGIRTVDSPVRMKILTMLMKREMSFDEIVDASGKVKSTVSVHLKGLADEGIINSRIDPTDARKKIFFINSGYLGGLSKRKKVEKDMEEYIAKFALGSGDPFAFFRFMFRTIRVSLLNEGIDIDPVLHDAGIKVGEALYRRIANDDMHKLIDNLAAFWKAQGLGTIDVKSIEPLNILVYDCFECQDLPYLGRPACAFDSGVLQSIFSEYFNEPVMVKETNCYSMGDSYCRFVVEKKII